MANLPDYQQALNHRTADAARLESGFLGFNPTGQYYHGGATRNENVYKSTPTEQYGLGPDIYALMAQQYHDAGQLNPSNNPYAAPAADSAAWQATGLTGAFLGAPVDAAIEQQAGAAAGIGGAGAGNAQAQNAQFGQTGTDLNVVRNSALGRGPSAAENLAQAQLAANQRAMAAQAATARGGNIAASQRMAMQGGQQMALQSMPQFAAQRAQEQLNAQGLLTQGNAAMNNAVGAARNTDINQAISSANAYDRVAGNQQALLGTRAGLVQNGQAALGASADRYDAGLARMLQARMQTSGNFANYGLDKYRADLGLSGQVAGTQANLAIANQEAARQREAALINAGSSAAAAAAQLIK